MCSFLAICRVEIYSKVVSQPVLKINVHACTCICMYIIILEYVMYNRCGFCVIQDEKQNRFDLVVINRVFQFYTTSADESQAWIDVLHAAISKFKPQEHEFREGGNMHNPEKQGILLKQGHGALNKGFKERYVALKGSKFAYYETKEVRVIVYC